jgi:hypothetical protein
MGSGTAGVVAKYDRPTNSNYYFVATQWWRPSGKELSHPFYALNSYTTPFGRLRASVGVPAEKSVGAESRPGSYVFVSLVF